MISVLIPVNNYDIVKLAKEIHHQLTISNQIFEMIIWDDVSDAHFTVKNSQIETLAHTFYKKSLVKKGRIETRQLLYNRAKFDWLLFLDADVLPKNPDFIKSYLDVISKNYDAIYGGYAYIDDTPDHDYVLRWTYGNAKEDVDAVARNQNPYKVVISGNFLIKKNVFSSINSTLKGQHYGYDNYFGAQLKEHNFKVYHINNEVYHMGLDKNEGYLKKVEQAVDTLIELHQNEKIKKSDNDLLNLFKFIKMFNCHHLLAFIFKKKQQQLTTNLLSPQPSINKLQFYKLGYMCYKVTN